ncbi:hypothetical protein CAPTEDRAFT_198165 [Capitella teleta]|uniref:CABIT domain-containing protein n=1 Tax=Capitella teleta TaxID=283909 RepID=X1ZYC4_CAPTE|nr:hypothetical protein CAPTEDRAFT_198165 [Capitella teleta]|eukprot:ELU04711.1 hypothetical protein CAPTEDRAFT_198165 [Capitella teleta]
MPALSPTSDLLWGDLPRLEWQTESTTLKDFAQNFNSPHIVRLEVNNLEDDLTLGVDPQKPLLAFSKRRRTRLYGENLAWDQRKGMFVPKGSIIEIPKDYMGWFEVLSQKKEEKPPEHYRLIADIAGSGAVVMLMCSLTMGFIGQVSEGEPRLLTEEKIFPGEVLQIKGPILKTWKMQPIEGRPEDPTLQVQTRFLWCLDRRGRDIFIPYAHPGKFCAIAQSVTQEKNVVYQVSTLAELNMPLVVRLVFGWPPYDLPDFTGLMRIGGYSRVESIVFSSLVPDKILIMELPLDVGLGLQKAANMNAVKESGTYEDVIHACCANVFPSVTGLKGLSVRYKRVRGEGEEDMPEWGRFATAMDMTLFSPLNVFPQQENTSSDQVSDSWALSFKDPEHLYDDVSNVISEDAVWVDVESRGPSRLIRSAKSNRASSTANDVGQSFTTIPQENVAMKPMKDERQRDLRAKRDSELLRREAEC